MQSKKISLESSSSFDIDKGNNDNKNETLSNVNEIINGDNIIINDGDDDDGGGDDDDRGNDNDECYVNLLLINKLKDKIKLAYSLLAIKSK